MPGRLGLRLDDIEGAAERILHDRLATRLACKSALERSLEPLQPLVVEARVAEDLRRDGALRVVAKLLRVEPETGVAELLELLGLARIRLPRDVDEAVRAVGQRRIQLGGVRAQEPARREREVACVVDLARVRVDRRREPADRERLAVAVDDRAACRRHDHGLAVLADRHGRVLGPLHHLEPDRPCERGGEKDEEGRGEEADPPIRRAGLHRPSWM